MAGGRIQRGWALAKRSYQVLLADRSLLLFPALSLAVSLVTAFFFFGPGVVIYNSDGQEPILILFGVVTLYALSVVTLFFNTALAAAASEVLAGRRPAVADGFEAARDRLGPIAQWALVQTTVGVAIAAAEALLRDDVVGRLAAGVVNVAWGVATFFVVPVIALEGLGPREAFKRSVALLKARWGEGVVGAASASAPIVLAAILVVGPLALGGFALLDGSPSLAVGLLVLAGLALIAAMVVAGTVSVIFRVALYQFATTGQAPGQFESADLAGAFHPKSRRKQREPSV